MVLHWLTYVDFNLAGKLAYEAQYTAKCKDIANLKMVYKTIIAVPSCSHLREHIPLDNTWGCKGVSSRYERTDVRTYNFWNARNKSKIACNRMLLKRILSAKLQICFAPYEARKVNLDFMNLFRSAYRENNAWLRRWDHARGHIHPSSIRASPVAYF